MQTSLSVFVGVCMGVDGCGGINQKYETLIPYHYECAAKYNNLNRLCGDQSYHGDFTQS